jgi:glycosyltransferase involved in cell wall biosynthesis
VTSANGKPMRVAVVAACPLPWPRGTPVRITRLAEALARRGHEVHVVAYHLGQGELGSGVHLHRIPSVPTYRKVSPGPTLQKLTVVDALLTMRLRRLLRTCAIDVIHAHHYEGLLAAVAARGRRGPPIVYDAHTLLSSELPYYRTLLPPVVAATVGWWLDAAVPRLAERVITVTDSIRDRLIEAGGLDPARVTVIGNGTELDRFARASDAPEHNALASEAAAGRGDPAHTRPASLVYAGNLAPYQGIDLLLKAVAALRASGRHVRLELVTESHDSLGDYGALARQLSLGDDVAHVVRADLSELPARLAAADVLVHPRPTCDGLPLKLLNYLAAARPIVSFAGSAPGVRHGREAWLVEEEDPAALATGIARLLDDPALAARLAKSARAALQQSWDGAAARVEDVLKAALADGHPAGSRVRSGSAHAAAAAAPAPLH